MVGMWFLLELTILVVARKPLLKLLLSLLEEVEQLREERRQLLR